MANFTDILNKPAESIEKPKQRPPGTYLCIVNGPHRMKEVNDKPVVSVNFKTMQAQEDVDQAALAEAGGVGNTVTQDYFLLTNDGNDNSWGLLQFLENHLGIEKAGKSLAQMLAEAPGKQVLVNVAHEMYVDKKTNEPAIAVRVKNTAKV
jgi:hypothetical protein